HVVPYGVDIPLESKTHIHKKVVNCLAVGRFVPKKSPLSMLKSFHIAASQLQELHLDYVGDGELRKDVENYIHENKLSEFVTLHGSQPNNVVYELMKQADIFLQHSITDPGSGDQEGLPVAILESMANGLPVVSTRHSGIPEAVIEGETGYLVNEGDIDNMAICILKLASDVHLREQFGKAAWIRAKNCFSWQREKQDLLSIIMK
ncbi:glycosyltransferase family 4 protein, partial [Thermodesulfobacteriota bacterium]